MKPLILLLIPVLAFLFFASSCSFKNANTVGGVIRLENLPRSPGPGRAEYDGYVVNVSGDGISPTSSSAALGDFAPICVDPGVSSLVVSYDTISKTGVKLRIPAGGSRKIEVLGVMSSYKTEILNQPVTRLFDNKRIPNLYSLAKSEGVELYKDKRIDLVGPANGAKPVDILRDCFSASGSSDLPLSAISALRIVVTSTNSTQNVQNVSLDIESGAMAIVQSLTGVSSFSKVVAPPSGSSVVAWDPIYGTNESFAVVQPGDLDSQGIGGATPFYSAQDLVFTDNGEFAISRTQPNLSYLKKVAGVYKSNSVAGAELLVSGEDILTFKNYFFHVNGYLGGGVIQGLAIPETGYFPSSTILDTLGSIMPTVSLGNESAASSKGLYLVYASGSNTVVQFYKAVGNLLTPLLPAVNIASSAQLTGARIALSPDGRFLYATSGPTATSQLLSYALNADGSIVFPGAAPLNVGYPSALAVDALSRYVVVLSANGTTTTLTAYTIGANGDFSNSHNLTSGLAPFASGMVVVPVR